MWADSHVCLRLSGGRGGGVPAMCLKWQKVWFCEIKRITGDGIYYLSAFHFSAPVPLFMILFLDMLGLTMFFLWLLWSPFNLKSSLVDFCRVRPTKISQQGASSTGTRNTAPLLIEVRQTCLIRGTASITKSQDPAELTSTGWCHLWNLSTITRCSPEILT